MLNILLSLRTAAIAIRRSGCRKAGTGCRPTRSAIRCTGGPAPTAGANSRCTGCRSSIRTGPSPTSRSLKRMHMRAGAARACPPRRSGNTRPEIHAILAPNACILRLRGYSAGAVVRRKLAMDIEQLCTLSGIPAGRRRHQRIQRQVHGQPVRAARVVLCHAIRPCAHQLSQLLPGRCPLAVFGDTPGAIGSRPVAASIGFWRRA